MDATANELRTGGIFLPGFREAVNYGPPTLHDIQVRKIIVVDHLGENIPVPEIFFSNRRVAFHLIAILFLSHV